MRLLSVSIRNFLSYEAADLDIKPGLTLVCGDNGAGKSTLISKAITWCLFGQTCSGLKADSVINNNELTSRCSVQVYFSVGTKFYVVNRQRNPNKLSISTSEGECQFRDPKETQLYINTIIGRDFQTFLNADYFGQDNKFRYIEQTPKVQLEILESALKLDRLEGPLHEVKKQLDTTVDILTTVERAIEAANLKIEFINRQMRSEAVAQQTEKVKLEAMTIPEPSPVSIEVLREQLLNLIEQDTQVCNQLNQLEIEHASLTARIGESERTVKTLQASLVPIQDKICPTCEQVVDKNRTDLLKKAYQEALREIQEQTDCANAFKTTRQAIKDQIFTLKSQNIKIQIKELNNQLKIEEAKEKFIQTHAMTVLALTEAIADKRRRIALLDTDRDAYLRELSGMQESKASHEKYLTLLKFWYNCFSKDFKNFIIGRSLPYLEARTAYHLRLLDNPKINIKFSTIKELKSGGEREGLNVQASVNSGGKSYDALSGGEKQIASFAIGLALSELADFHSGSRSNVIILDEPFTELDGKNCENIVHYLQDELLKRKETIFLISNDDRIKSLVPNIIEVTKGLDGNSKLHVY